MEEGIKTVLDFLSSRGYSLCDAVLVGAMTTFIFIILSVLKVPIKAITSHIKNEKLRKLANKVIILLAFGLSIGLWMLAHRFYPAYVAIDRVEILLTGSLPIVAYALGDGILTKPNAKAVVKKILEVTEDGHIDGAELAAIAATLKSKNGKTEKESEILSDAESALCALLGK